MNSPISGWSRWWGSATVHGAIERGRWPSPKTKRRNGLSRRDWRGRQEVPSCTQVSGRQGRKSPVKPISIIKAIGWPIIVPVIVTVLKRNLPSLVHNPLTTNSKTKILRFSPNVPICLTLDITSWHRWKAPTVSFLTFIKNGKTRSTNSSKYRCFILNDQTCFIHGI